MVGPVALASAVRVSLVSLGAAAEPPLAGGASAEAASAAASASAGAAESAAASAAGSVTALDVDWGLGGRGRLTDLLFASSLLECLWFNVLSFQS